MGKWGQRCSHGHRCENQIIFFLYLYFIFLLIFQNLEKAEETADLEETKSRVMLKRIEGENESWERFYEFDDSPQSASSFKTKTK